jgi:hypothetical protein
VGRNQSAVVCGAVDDLLTHACKVGDKRRHRSCSGPARRAGVRAIVRLAEIDRGQEARRSNPEQIPNPTAQLLYLMDVGLTTAAQPRAARAFMRRSLNHPPPVGCSGC